MKLAFSGQARYPDYTDGYALYTKRSKTGIVVDKEMYSKVVRAYCRRLADELLEEGMIDLPCELGSIAAAIITRRPQYRGKKFIGYGKMDWKKGHFDGKLKAFGLVYLPRRGKNANLRSYGFVANRKLFQKMQKHNAGFDCKWMPIVFNDDMI